ncbi:MAG: GldG family protein [Syntrophobacteraceae bacterium]
MSTKNKRRSKWAYGSSTIISSLFFLGILTFVALIAERHPWRVDLTETGMFTLSEKTRNIISSIDKPIQIKAFIPSASPEQARVRDLFDSYRYHTKNITYELVDPDREPDVARRYEVRTYGTIVLEGFDKKQTVQALDEETVTNAILKLSRKEEKKIYFLKGHGEHALDNTEREGYSNAKAALKKENYLVEELNLMQLEQVPKDAALVIVAGPQKNLFDQELASLKSYVDSGGKLMVLLDPSKDGGMSDFLKGYGIQIKDDIVIDKLSRVFGGSYLTPVVMNYGMHRITRDFQVATFYPEARSVSPLKDAPKNIAVEILASTSENSWGETNLALLNQGQAAFDEKEDMSGPVPLVVLATITKSDAEEKGAPGEVNAEQPKKPDQNGKSFLLAAGDSDFISNTQFGLQGNGDFFLNMANFLSEEENLITIEPRKKTGRVLLMTKTQESAFFWVVMVLVPLIVLFVGFAVYRVRRSQR